MKIKDLGTIITGKTPLTKKEEFWNGNIPFITPADLQKSKHIENTERTITNNGALSVKGSIIPANSICVSCIGNIGYVSMCTQKSVTNQQINSIIPNSNNNPDFIYYVMKSLWPYFKNYEGQSTTVSILNKTQFSEIEIPYVKRETQDKIADLLNSLDKKIELNNKINDNLSNYNSTESTSISPDMSFGKRASRRFASFWFSESFLPINKNKGLTNSLNSVISSLFNSQIGRAPIFCG